MALKSSDRSGGPLLDFSDRGAWITLLLGTNSFAVWRLRYCGGMRKPNVRLSPSRYPSPSLPNVSRGWLADSAIWPDRIIRACAGMASCSPKRR